MVPCPMLVDYRQFSFLRRLNSSDNSIRREILASGIDAGCIDAHCLLATTHVNPRPAGGGRICPLLVFQNNSKTAADIETKFGEPYPTSI